MMLYHTLSAIMVFMMSHGILLACNLWHHVSFCFFLQQSECQMSSFIMHPSYSQLSTYHYLHMYDGCSVNTISSFKQLPCRAVWTPGAIVHTFNALLLPTIPPIPARQPVISHPSSHTIPPDCTSIHCGSTVSHPAIVPLPTWNSTQSLWPVIQPSFPNLETCSVRHKSPVQYRAPASTAAPISSSG